MKNTKPARLSIGQASEYLNVSIDTMRRWEKRGKIESLRSPGNHRYFSLEDLDKLFGKRYQHDNINTESVKKPDLNESTPEIKRVEPEKEGHMKVPETAPYSPVTYPTPEIAEDKEILDRPVRDVIIPEMKLIKVIKEKEDVVTVSENQFLEVKTETTGVSVLTPSNITPQVNGPKENSDEAVENQPQQNKTGAAKKNNLLFYTLLIIAVLIIAALIFFLIGVSSQKMLSPVP
jgi:excisionase family DNA binding protein